MRILRAPPSRKSLCRDTELRIPIREVQDGDMHLFSTDVGGGQVVRFMIIKKPDGWGTALDACRICGAEGYRQDGQNVICRHCGSAIYVPTIGEAGGCNPDRRAVACRWRKSRTRRFSAGPSHARDSEVAESYVPPPRCRFL